MGLWGGVDNHDVQETDLVSTMLKRREEHAAYGIGSR
jgi:hypothetical protein